MTVSNTNSRNTATGDGVMTAFTFTFKAFAPSELQVFVNGVLKTLTTDYTVTITQIPEGGTVTFVTPPPNGQPVVIRRNLSATQPTALPTEDRLPAATLETAFDRAVMLIQQTVEGLSRAFSFPSTYTGSASVAVPVPSAGKALVWNGTADALINSTSTFDSIVADATTQANNAAASASSASTSAGTATTQASNAAASASNALASETAAAASAASINVRTINDQAAGYTVAASDRNKLVKHTGTGATFALTAAATLGSGFEVVILHGGASGSLIIDPAGAETIDGSATISLTTGQAVTIVSTGTAWLITQARGFGAGAGTVTSVTGARGVRTGTGGAITATGEYWGDVPVSARTGAYTLVAADRGALQTCTNTFTLGVTAAATLGAGWYCLVRNTGTGTVTIDPNASEQVDGATTRALASGESCVLVCTGTAFFTVGYSAALATQAQMETGTSTAVAVTPGVQRHHLLHPKAFGRITTNTTTALQYGSGIGTLTDNGVGDTTVNWTVAFSSVNYAVTGNSMRGATAEGGKYAEDTYATGSFRTYIRNDAGVLEDGRFTIAAWGDQ
jgi:hypothetical protein